MPDSNNSSVFTTKNEIVLRFDYPLEDEHDFKFVSKSGSGFTVSEIVALIQETYQKEIYKDETTKAEYGVWGHGIDDLVIVGFDDEGDHISLHIDS